MWYKISAMQVVTSNCRTSAAIKKCLARKALHMGRSTTKPQLSVSPETAVAAGDGLFLHRWQAVASQAVAGLSRQPAGQLEPPHCLRTPGERYPEPPTDVKPKVASRDNDRCRARTDQTLLF